MRSAPARSAKLGFCERLGETPSESSSSVLGSDREQGFITRSVTNYLNIAGGVALAVWAWDIAAEPGGRKRFAGWLALVAILVLLAWLHGRMDRLLDPEELKIRDGRRFRELHRVYLTSSTVQWAASLVLMAWTMWVWRRRPAA